MNATNTALLGVLFIAFGGVAKGMADRFIKHASERPGYNKDSEWAWVFFFVGYTLGGAGFIWHGTVNVSDFWEVLFSLPFCFIAWFVGYSVTRPR